MTKIYYSCYVGNSRIYPNTYWEEHNPNTGKKIKDTMPNGKIFETWKSGWGEIIRSKERMRWDYSIKLYEDIMRPLSMYYQYIIIKIF